jgi:cytochrome c biogenesis protein CcmG, thiol:disulfide interchange protein DsbE
MGPMRSRALFLAFVALVAVICVVLLVGGSDSPDGQSKENPAAARAFDGAPPPLHGLYDDRNKLLPGGAAGFRRRIADLRGYPVVVNKWASWCGPCRAEFPVFQKASIQEAKRIAFLGVNSSDNDDNARTFLGDFPLSYPSYVDPDLKVAREFNGVGAFPTTAFYDKQGKVAYTHQGPYRSVAELLRDARRYAGA